MVCLCLFSDHKEDTEVFVYSQERGYLYLRKERRDEHDIRTWKLSLNWTHQCFGERFGMLVMKV